MCSSKLVAHPIEFTPIFCLCDLQQTTVRYATKPCVPLSFFLFTVDFCLCGVQQKLYAICNKSSLFLFTAYAMCNKTICNVQQEPRSFYSQLTFAYTICNKSLVTFVLFYSQLNFAYAMCFKVKLVRFPNKSDGKTNRRNISF